MTLPSFVTETRPPTHTLPVVSSEKGSLQDMLAEVFAEQSIDIKTCSELDVETETLVALDGEEVVAASPMAEVYEDLFAVNSDLYVTGTRGLGEISIPDALYELTETTLALRGYPLAHKEMLILITISCYVEQLAWEAERSRHERGVTPNSPQPRLTFTPAYSRGPERNRWTPESTRDVRGVPECLVLDVSLTADPLPTSNRRPCS